MNNYDEIIIKEMSPIDAYNYGRQMMEKELNAMGDCEYAKGRADAIEEVIKLYKEFQPKLATNVYELGERLRQMQKGGRE